MSIELKEYIDVNGVPCVRGSLAVFSVAMLDELDGEDVSRVRDRAERTLYMYAGLTAALWLGSDLTPYIVVGLSVKHHSVKGVVIWIDYLHASFRVQWEGGEENQFSFAEFHARFKTGEMTI